MKRLMLVAMVLSLAGMSYAQSSANGTATINAYIEKGLTMSVSNSTLNLGNLVAGTTPAAVNPASGTVPTFTVTGDGGHAVNVTYDASVMLTTAGDSLSFATDFRGDGTNDQAGATTVPASVNLSNSSPASGNFYMWLGGNVGTIPSAQTPGTYTGTFHVLVSY